MKRKLEGQVSFLQSIHRPEVQEAIDGLSAYLAKIEKAKDKRDAAVGHNNRLRSET